MIRTVAAIIAGYLVMAILTGTVTYLLAQSVPELAQTDRMPPVWYMLVNLTYSSLFALAGGFVTAAIASPPRVRAALVLAALMVVLAILYVAQAWGGVQPRWYLVALVLMGGPSAALGGYLRGRRDGVPAVQATG